MSLRNPSSHQPRIFNISAVYWMKTPEITAFQWRFRDVHAYNMVASATVYMKKNAIAEMHQRRWAAKTDSLWVTCAAYKAIGPMQKSTVRNWVLRRVKSAFKESLRKKGYNHDGTKSDNCAEEKDIFGTVLLLPGEVAVRMKYVDLVGQTDLALQNILDCQGPKSKAKADANGTGTRKAKRRKAQEQEQIW